MQLGFTAEEARSITRKGRILKNSDHGTKGDFVESVMDKMMEKQGYTKLESKVGSNNGYDGLYVLKDSQGNVTKVVIGEAKYGTSRLRQTRTMGKQMDKQWIDTNWRKMGDSKNQKVVRAYRDIDIQINSNDYEKVLFTITRDGVVKAKRIN